MDVQYQRSTQYHHYEVHSIIIITVSHPTQGCMSLCQPVTWSMTAMLHDSFVVVVVVAIVCTRPRAIQLAMITMRKSTHGFPFVSHIWDIYGAPLGGPLGRRSSAVNLYFHRGQLKAIQLVNAHINVQTV